MSDEETIKAEAQKLADAILAEHQDEMAEALAHMILYGVLPVQTKSREELAKEYLDK